MTDTEGTQPTLPEQPAAEAIFIVGVSRSGTTLMRQVLRAHSRIAIADENHYLGHLLPGYGGRDYLRRAGDLTDDAAVHRLVELVYGASFQGGDRLRPASTFWKWLAKNVPAADLEARILAGERSERGVFTAFLRAYADKQGKDIFGEKTPAHIKFAELLIEWYPGARIIHMIRDPRGVYVSELRRRIGKPVAVPYRWLVHVPILMRLFVLHEVTWAWAVAVSRHRELSRRIPASYRMVRFEDLVRDPETTVAGVCAFLGVAMEPKMLQQKMVSNKERAGEPGIDPGTADQWQSRIGRGTERWMRFLLGGRLRELGFEGTDVEA